MTYVFEPNAVDIATLRLDSNDIAEVTLYMKLEGVDVVWPIGLDGKYRMASSGQALRGYWADSQTFVIEVFEDGPSILRLHFEDDRVEINSPEQGLRFEGWIGNP